LGVEAVPSSCTPKFSAAGKKPGRWDKRNGTSVTLSKEVGRSDK
jgi:hypothetical protein